MNANKLKKLVVRQCCSRQVWVLAALGLSAGSAGAEP